MRIFLILGLLLVSAGLVHSGPDDAAERPSWRVVSFQFPDGKRTADTILPHGEHALIIASDPAADQSLWIARGDALEALKIDGKPITGDFVYDELSGEPAVVSITDFSTEKTTFALVSEGKAVRIHDAENKPFTGKLYFSRRGDRILAVPTDGPKGQTRPSYLLIDNVLHKITDSAGKPLLSHLSSLDKHPGGRLVLRRANILEDGFEELEPHWLEGAKATPFGRPAAPEDWDGADVEYEQLALEKHTLVVGRGADSCRAWLVRDGKTEWVVGASGNPIEHLSITIGFLGNKTYLFAAEDDGDSGFDGYVYQVEGSKALKLTVPEGKHLGWPYFEPRAGMPLLVCTNDQSIDELWLISGNTIAPLATADGKHVRPAADDDLEAWQLGDLQLVKYMTPQGYYYGRVDGTTLRGIGDAEPISATKHECAWHEVDGDLFFRSASPFSGHLAVIENGKPVRLKVGDADLSGVEISTVRSRKFLWVMTTNAQDESTTYIVRKD